MDDRVALNQAKNECRNKIRVIKEQIKEKNKLHKEVAAVASTILSPEERIDRLEVIAAEIKELEEEKEKEEKSLGFAGKIQTNVQVEKVAEAMKLVASEVIEKDPSVAYVTSNSQFVMVGDDAEIGYEQNIQIRRVNTESYLKDLAKKIGVSLRHLPAMDVHDTFIQHGRQFKEMRFSVKEGKWNHHDNYLPFEHLEQYFISNLPVKEEDIDPMAINCFEALMYSITGGKEENQEHLEKWIIHKIINYRKVITTPDLVIVGHVGGNGKSLLGDILGQMLVKACVGKANAKTLMNGFNGIVEGNLIVIMDEQDESGISQATVKEQAGAETYIQERKGFEQVEVDKCYNAMWFSNKLPFKLSPDGGAEGVDRRWSVMRTSITFLESIRKMFLEKYDQEITPEETKAVTNTIVEKYLKNREYMAQWYLHLRSKHPDVDEDFVLKTLHGDDYRYFVKRQSNPIDRMWNLMVKTLLNQGKCVPLFVARQALSALDPDNKITNESMKKQIMEKGAKDNMNVIVKQCRYRIVCAKSNKTFEKNNECFLLEGQKLASKDFEWNQVSRLQYNPHSTGTDVIPPDALGGVFADDADDDSDDDWISDGEKEAQRAQALLDLAAKIH